MRSCASSQAQGSGFSDMLMGAANAFFTAEAVDEALDLVEEAGGVCLSSSGTWSVIPGISCMM